MQGGERRGHIQPVVRVPATQTHIQTNPHYAEALGFLDAPWT